MTRSLMNSRGSERSRRPVGGAVPKIKMASSVPPPMDDVDERRSQERIEVSWPVDCETEQTFLYAAIANISELGIFVRSDAPLAIGTLVRLRFAPRGKAFGPSGVGEP